MIPKQFIGWLTVNRGCNLACKWCYAQDAIAKTMTMETFYKALNLFKELPMSIVVILGGEPTLHKQYLAMIKEIVRAGLIPITFTNGIRFADGKFTERVIEAGIRGVNVSIKASSNSQYKELTGNAAFYDVVRGIANIEQIRPKGVFNKPFVTLCAGIKDTIDEMLAVLASTKVEFITFNMEHPYLQGNKFVNDGMLSAQELADFMVSIYPKMLKMGIPFNIRVGIPFCLFPSGFIEVLAERGQIISGCQIYNGSGVIIDEQGQILPCNAFVNHPLGTLDECSTAERYYAWRKEVYVENFYKRIGSCPDKRCEACEHWTRCGAGCPINWLCEGANQQTLPKAVGELHGKG